ncbi:hypothetical protein [Actinacidiphila glaucinigra]
MPALAGAVPHVVGGFVERVGRLAVAFGVEVLGGGSPMLSG